MKSFLVSMAIWAGLFGPFWYGAHERFFPPGDWIGALIASLAITLGIEGLRRAWIERRDAFILSRPDGPPRDGRRVAITGTIEPMGESLVAPLTGRACLAYEYEIGHVDTGSVLEEFDGRTKNKSRSRREVVDWSGYGLAPSVIRSGVREALLLAFPGLERFPWSAKQDISVDRARAYVAATTFAKQSLVSGFGDIARLLADRSGHVREDWRMTSHDDLEGSFFNERILPVGAKACVIGRYSERERGIVPEANTGGVRVISGTRDEALEFLRDKTTGSWIAAALFLAVPAPVLWGILTHREHYLIGQGRESVAASLGTLASGYLADGKFVQAEALFKRSLAVKEDALGPGHVVVAAGLDDLARAYRDQGKLAQAEPLLVRSLAIREKALGANHPEVQRGLEELAALYESEGKNAQAAPLHERYVATLQATLGPENPGAARALSAQASRYQAEGRRAEAESLYLRALAIEEKLLGPDHEDVAETLGHLASCYDEQGRFAQAEPLHRRALAIWEKVLGPNGDRVAMTLEALAVDYRKAGRATEASGLERRAKAIWAARQ